MFHIFLIFRIYLFASGSADSSSASAAWWERAQAEVPSTVVAIICLYFYLFCSLIYLKYKGSDRFFALTKTAVLVTKRMSLRNLEMIPQHIFRSFFSFFQFRILKKSPWSHFEWSNTWTASCMHYTIIPNHKLSTQVQNASLFPSYTAHALFITYAKSELLLCQEWAHFWAMSFRLCIGHHLLFHIRLFFWRTLQSHSCSCSSSEQRENIKRKKKALMTDGRMDDWNKLCRICHINEC